MTRRTPSVALLGAPALLWAQVTVAQPAAAPVPAPQAAAPPAPAAPGPVAPAPAAAPAPTPAPAAPPPAATPALATEATAPAVPATAPAPATVQVAPAPTPPPAAPYDGPPLLFNSGKGKPKLGAHGGIGVAYTHMLHRDGAVVDISGAILVDHRLSLGLAGTIFTRSPNGPSFGFTPREYQTLYGGFLIRYAFFGNFPLYASVGALLGGGTLALVEDFDREYDHDHHDDSWDSDGSQFRGYFVAQPDISLHINATRWFRFTATGGYRFATAAHDFGYDSTAMSGAVVGGKLEFGWF